MATRRLPILGAGTIPDTSGNVFCEPMPSSPGMSAAPWRRMVFTFATNESRIGLHGGFMVPLNYDNTPKLIIHWTTSGVSQNAVWDFEYRAIGSGESLIQGGYQQLVSGIFPSPTSTELLCEATLPLTAGNFSPSDQVFFTLYNDRSDPFDNLTQATTLIDLFFEFADVS